MKANKINKVSLNTGWEILWKAWDLAKVNYKLSVVILPAIFLLVFITSFIIGFITSFFGTLIGLSISSEGSQIIGIITDSFIMSFVPLVYTICAFHWEKGDPYSLRKVLSDLKDKKIMKPLLPLIMTSFLISCGPGVIKIFDHNTVTVLVFISLTCLLFFVLNFCYPVLFFKPETGLGGAFIKSLQGILKNILPLVVGVILSLFMLVICLICLVVPVILIAAPVYISFYYLWYRVIFEDLKLESDEKPLI